MNRHILGLIVSTALLFLGYMYLSARYLQKPHAPEEAQQGIGSISATPPPPVPSLTAAPAALVQKANIDTAFLNFVFSAQGGCLTESTLKKYFYDVKKPVPMQALNNYLPCQALGFRNGNTDLRQAPAEVLKLGALEVHVSQRTNGLAIRRRFSFSEDGYTANLYVDAMNETDNALTSVVGIELGGTSEPRGVGGFLSSGTMEFQQLDYRIGDETHREKLPFQEAPVYKELKSQSNAVFRWIATTSNYFMLGLIPAASQPENLVSFATGNNVILPGQAQPTRTVYEVWLDHPIQLAPRTSQTWGYQLYIGPKSKSELSKVKGSADAHLEEVVEYGFFKIVAWPLFYALSFFHDLLKNWGVAIVVLTALIKALFFPLARKAYLAGKKMQKLQPELAAIKEKYPDDKQKQSQETMALMAAKGANPISGCLPLFAQMPVFFALYSVLQHTFELRHAPFYGWIVDLSIKDPFYITPAVLCGLMFLQQKLTPVSGMDPAQAKIMTYMPILFSLLMLTLPSGLVLYMITNSAISIIQQQYMMKKYHNV